MRSKIPTRKIEDLYSSEQLTRIRRVVEVVMGELDLSYEGLARAINNVAGEHRCTKDSLNRIAHAGRNTDRAPISNQIVMGLLDIALVSSIYKIEDLKAIALGNPPVSERALSYHPEDKFEKIASKDLKASEESSRCELIIQELNWLVKELEKEFKQMQEVEIVTVKEPLSDEEIRHILLSSTTARSLKTSDLILQIGIQDIEMIVEFVSFVDGKAENLSERLRANLLFWLENAENSPLKNGKLPLPKEDFEGDSVKPIS